MSERQQGANRHLSIAQHIKGATEGSVDRDRGREVAERVESRLLVSTPEEVNVWILICVLTVLGHPASARPWFSYQNQVDCEHMAHVYNGVYGQGSGSPVSDLHPNFRCVETSMPLDGVRKGMVTEN